MQGKRIQVDESGAIPRMQRCYRIEYFLLPDDLGPRSLDLVLFGVVAKLFTESDSKLVVGSRDDDGSFVLRGAFHGEKSVISHLAENNPEVLDAYVTFTVETPLLSERQRR
ncbi:hypothetical protein QYF61_024027 [Mycteria americana]|uniref:DUF4550 domain-containing protein n=1 Tax=Mycteria americana TaxID=33587 RepID=A0AAN7S1Q2_MYCAM|nr:hypothetical protein QYF61_024027 [Mycteria americana]